MGLHVCPWWFAYTFDHPLRRLFHRPEQMFARLVQPGDTVVDIGCGMGFFAIALAAMVGPTGRVIAVDLQERMLEVLQRRAARRGLQARLQLQHCPPEDLGVATPVDFALAFWMVHETPNPLRLLQQVHALLKPRARFLLAEPWFHVSARDFERLAQTARAAGLAVETSPHVALSRALLFRPAAS